MPRRATRESRDDARKQLLALKFRTELCANVMSTGFCTHGSNCRFAHSPAQLRTVEQNAADELNTMEAVSEWIASHEGPSSHPCLAVPPSW